MEKLGLALILIALGTCLAVLAFRCHRASRRRHRSRASYFDECRSLLGECRQGLSPAGFPRLDGIHRGLRVDLQAVPDTLTFRKLPALWVLVTLPTPMPVRATLDLMIRPTGGEPFSSFHVLPEQIAVPAGFPEDCAIRTDTPNRLMPESVLRRHLALFDDRRVKELVISPKGIRIVFLAEEADRGRYLIFRDAEMGLTPLPPARVAPVLDRLLAIKLDIERLSSDKPERNVA